VIDFANRGGKVLGVCNGFQILCESNLLPGVLLKNGSQQFVCKNVYLKSAEDDILKIPIAHGDGRYFASEDVLDGIEENKQVIFRYCDQNGNCESVGNPNGAYRNIAGIKNQEGNVFGMMPHPERAVSPELGNVDGVRVFSLLGLN
jgi:phosphoribosylformylglycinamidine synthase